MVLGTCTAIASNTPCFAGGATNDCKYETSINGIKQGLHKITAEQVVFVHKVCRDNVDLHRQGNGQLLQPMGDVAFTAST